MDRRDFTKSLLGTLGFVGSSWSAMNFGFRYNNPRIIKPNRLKKGQKIGLICPGSSVSAERLELAKANVALMGCEPVVGKNALAKKGYLAGEDAQRLADLHDMFKDRSISAIWCVRGGYGCGRLLPKIDFNLIKKNPKILIGYSDITALTTSIHMLTGLITFHGPIAAADFPDYSQTLMQEVLFAGKSRIELNPFPDPTIINEPTNLPYTIKSGLARGRLMGGNLSVLASLVGTPWQFNSKNRIIFLEDIDEKPYRIDRMLVQLRQSDCFEDINALAYGMFKGCNPEPNDASLTLQETLKAQSELLKMPCAYGMPFGHISEQCTLPLGVMAAFDADKRILRIEESGVK